MVEEKDEEFMNGITERWKDLLSSKSGIDEAQLERMKMGWRE